MTVRTILDTKGHPIVSVEPETTLSAAVKLLGERKIGAVLVMSHGRVEGILSEFARLGEEAPSDEELSDSQAFMTGVLPLTLETNEGVANQLLNMERHGLGLDYLRNYAGLVNAVTVEDVREMARKYLDPETYVLAVAGPAVGEEEAAQAPGTPAEQPA